MSVDFSHIQGVIWDLDNTLYRFSEDFKHHCNIAAAKAAQELGISLNYEDSFKLAQLSEAEHGYSLHGYITHHGFSYESLHVPFHSKIDENVIEVIEGVTEGLRFLKEKYGIKQSILTNASRCWAERVLKKIEVRDLFLENHIIAVEDVGYQSKAETHEGFTQAIKAMGLAPDQVVMVDDLDRNLIIPHEMGLQTILIAYDDSMPDPPRYIDRQVYNILDVFQGFEDL